MMLATMIKIPWLHYRGGGGEGEDGVEVVQAIPFHA